MKKILAVIMLLSVIASASAATWWYNGVLYGNVCRNGYYYTVYPRHQAQPVGSNCLIRNNYGNVVGEGIVSNE